MLIEKYLKDVQTIKKYIVVFKIYNKIGVAFNKLHGLAPETVTSDWLFYDKTMRIIEIVNSNQALMNDNELRSVLKTLKSRSKLLKVPNNLKKKYFTINYMSEIWIAV